MKDKPRRYAHSFGMHVRLTLELLLQEVFAVRFSW